MLWLCPLCHICRPLPRCFEINFDHNPCCGQHAAKTRTQLQTFAEASNGGSIQQPSLSPGPEILPGLQEARFLFKRCDISLLVFHLIKNTSLDQNNTNSSTFILRFDNWSMIHQSIVTATYHFQPFPPSKQFNHPNDALSRPCSG